MPLFPLFQKVHGNTSTISRKDLVIFFRRASGWNNVIEIGFKLNWNFF